MESIIVALVAGGIALAFAAFMAWRVIRADAGNARMTEIGDAIRAGASAFLRREYMSLLPFVVVVAVVLGVLDYTVFEHGLSVPATAISYLVGTICSGLAGFVGMNVAVRANVRTAAAAMRGLNPALRVAFSSGTVMGRHRGGHRPAGRNHPVPDFPGHQRGGRIRLRRQLHRPVRPRRRRHLYQGR